MNFSNDQIYKMKYLKYKAKYEQLKGGSSDGGITGELNTNGIDNKGENEKAREAKEANEKYEKMGLNELSTLKNELVKELGIIEPILQQKLNEEEARLNEEREKARLKEEKEEERLKEEARLKSDEEERLKKLVETENVNKETTTGAESRKYYKNQPVNVNGFRKYYKY